MRSFNLFWGSIEDLTPLEIVLDKEAWMDELPEKEMSELQKAAFSEYQNKEKVRFEAFRGM